MRRKLDLIKLIAGVGGIGFLLYRSLGAGAYGGFGWRNLAVSAALVLLLTGSISFTRGQESTWVFFVGMAVTAPFNKKAASLITSFFLSPSATPFWLIYAGILFMCLLSVEEIILGILARIVWREQEGGFDVVGRERRK